MSYYAENHMISSAVGNLRLFLIPRHKRRKAISTLNKFIVYFFPQRSDITSADTKKAKDGNEKVYKCHEQRDTHTQRLVLFGFIFRYYKTMALFMMITCNACWAEN